MTLNVKLSKLPTHQKTDTADEDADGDAGELGWLQVC